MNDTLSCACCASPFSFRWTDTHGIGICTTCGMPYRIIHYNEQRERQDLPPSMALMDHALPMCSRYFKETGRKVVPGEFDMGFLHGRSCTYSGITRDDVEHWNEWVKAHKAEYPELFTEEKDAQP